jgi:hypothetical protein
MKQNPAYRSVLKKHRKFWKNISMKRSEIFFSAIQVPVDLMMILLAAATAYFLRGLPLFEGYVSRVFNLSFENYLMFTLTVAPLFLFILAVEGLYTMRSTRRFWQEAYGVMKAITFGLIILIIAVFLNREWFSSRFVILVGWALSVFLCRGRTLFDPAYPEMVFGT